MILARRQRARGAEVADLAAGVAGPAQLDRNLLSGSRSARERLLGAGAAQGEPAAFLGPQCDDLADAHVRKVRRSGEDARPAVEIEPRVGGLDRHRAAERQHDHLVIAGHTRWLPAGSSETIRNEE